MLPCERGIDMLLAEGMNVKLLLLPDGDDPDSFSRKHNSEEFRNYVGDHQVDFIIFKTRLLLDGVTDPIKRSEAISNIVRSVSVIPDQIKRDTYIRECSRNFQMNEQTLINTMNRFIGGDIENQQKEAERQLRQQEAAAQTQQQPQQHASFHSSDKRALEVERLIIQLIIQHGEEIIYRDIETEDGQLVNLTVAQYIDYDLAQDDLHFSSPLFDRILHEAAIHSSDEGFKADTYFTSHADIGISRLAGSLAMNHYQLSKSLQMRTDAATLQQKTEHLIVDFRIGIKTRLINDLKHAIAEANKASDMAKVRELMKEQMEAQKLRDTIAAKVGRDIVR